MPTKPSGSWISSIGSRPRNRSKAVPSQPSASTASRGNSGPVRPSTISQSLVSSAGSAEFCVVGPFRLTGRPFGRNQSDRGVGLGSCSPSEPSFSVREKACANPTACKRGILPAVSLRSMNCLAACTCSGSNSSHSSPMRTSGDPRFARRSNSSLLRVCSPRVNSQRNWIKPLKSSDVPLPCPSPGPCGRTLLRPATCPSPAQSELSELPRRRRSPRRERLRPVHQSGIMTPKPLLCRSGPISFRNR